MNQEQILEAFNKSLDLSGDFLKTTWEENSTIEFKLTLHTKSQEIDKAYLPTISGLANNAGGLVVFGIENITKEIKGIKKEHENLDNRYFSSAVRPNLDGNFNYFFFTGKFIGKIVGFLYVEEAVRKPIMLKTNADNVIRGEIYYRYPAQTTRIEAADLRRVIEEEIEKRLSTTISTIKKVLEIKSDNLALINIKSGEIETNDPNTKYTLDEDLLGKLNLIKSGHFVENDGAPAYVIKGEIEVERNPEYIDRHIPTLIQESELYEAFFVGSCEHPEVMLQQLLFQNTQYNPLFFFIHQASISIEAAQDIFNKFDSKDIISTTKSKLLSRLVLSTYHDQGAIIESVKHTFIEGVDAEELIQKLSATLLVSQKGTEQQIARTLCLNTLLKGISLPKDIYINHLKRALEAMSKLTPEFLTHNRGLLVGELFAIYNMVRTHDETSLMRKVICNMDKAIYEDKVLQKHSS